MDTNILVTTEIVSHPFLCATGMTTAATIQTRIVSVRRVQLSGGNFSRFGRLQVRRLAWRIKLHVTMVSASKGSGNAMEHQIAMITLMKQTGDAVSRGRRLVDSNM